MQQMEGTQFLPLATIAGELYRDWGMIKSEVFGGLCHAPILLMHRCLDIIIPAGIAGIQKPWMALTFSGFC